MEFRCPECVSPEVEPFEYEQRCANCGARFPRRQALVTVLDAETPRLEISPPPLFTFDPSLAEHQLRHERGSMATIDAYSDAEELQTLLDAAEASDVIVANRDGAGLFVYPMSISEPDPILAVYVGVGPTVLGHSLRRDQEDGEDPDAFTVRFLSDAVDEANALAAGRAADGVRLDRIAGYINVPGEVQGADFLEFVERELRASGRIIEVE